MHGGPASRVSDLAVLDPLALVVTERDQCALGVVWLRPAEKRAGAIDLDVE